MGSAPETRENALALGAEAVNSKESFSGRVRRSFVGGRAGMSLCVCLSILDNPRDLPGGCGKRVPLGLNSIVP